MGKDQHVNIEPIDERDEAKRESRQEEEEREFIIHEGFTGDPSKTSFLGYSYSAIPLVVQAESAEEAVEKLKAVWGDVLDLIARHEGVELPSSVLVQYGCYSQAAAMTKEFIDKEAGSN